MQSMLLLTSEQIEKARLKATQAKARLQALIPTAESSNLSAHGALQDASSGTQVKTFGGWYKRRFSLLPWVE